MPSLEGTQTHLLRKDTPEGRSSPPFLQTPLAHLIQAKPLAYPVLTQINCQQGASHPFHTVPAERGIPVLPPCPQGGSPLRNWEGDLDLALSVGCLPELISAILASGRVNTNISRIGTGRILRGGKAERGTFRIYTEGAT